MLQPRETDLPALFLFLVVLPLAAYILLGKWSEASKKKDIISKLAQIAAEEAFRVDSMAAAAVMPILPPVQIPFVPLSNNGTHECARCHGPATTRCSRCKSVRYCSGKCQIIHWRQVHKHECQNLEYNSSKASPSRSNEDSFHENFLLNESVDLQFSESNVNHSGHEKSVLDDTNHPPVCSVASGMGASKILEASGLMAKRKSIDKRGHRRSKSNREILTREEGPIESAEEASGNRASCSTSYDNTLKDTSGHKFKECHLMHQKEGISEKTDINIPGGTYGCETETQLMNGGSLHMGERTSSSEATRIECSSERASMKRGNTVKISSSHYPSTKMHKSVKSAAKVSKDQSCSDMETLGQVADEPKVARMRDTNPAQAGNGVSNTGFMKMIGLMRSSSKHDKVEQSESNGDRHKKIKMLFPYEEFLKFFQYEVFNLLPRGLVNCGNSCYANAVLQCLTCTKPLTIYLLNRSHSRSCGAKDWCLMCELEQHVTMLRESGGPLSLSKILFHMRSVNCQMGDGSQEDAHEFLRLLVTSMQSICLERLGGENAVDPWLQETTFIQHTFGGRLRSKVKCLRCHHESERYENIMDLTLEIYGWVESLEDALTQFTSPENLDGENMYRCGRCATYVRAQKQLDIQVAPNILTIVLKRFQEGSYGKINKCITFPDMLDMIPFMTGTADIPPLYMLYGVVVHLDTHNASFSGHYISYVKNLQGSWFRIDDTEVQPVSMSQVMSEGAYILFYMRSCPRPSRGQKAPPGSTKHWTTRTPRSSSDHRQEMMGMHRSSSSNRPPMMETYTKPSSVDFSDTTSSDWSIFTSSDDASFTTESTRDSFSTVDYADACNDPISSIFSNLYAPEYMSQQNVSYSRFSGSGPHTRLVSEVQPPYRLYKDRRDGIQCSSVYDKYYDRDGIRRTSDH